MLYIKNMWWMYPVDFKKKKKIKIKLKPHVRIYKYTKIIHINI